MHAAQGRVVDRHGSGGVADGGAPTALCWTVRCLAPLAYAEAAVQRFSGDAWVLGGGEDGGECGRHAWA